MIAADPAALAKILRKCPDCRVGVLWGRTVNELWMPLDGQPVSTGNVAVYVDPDGGRWPRVQVIGRATVREGMTDSGWVFFQHHRMSCPAADMWARKPVHQRPQPPKTATDLVEVPTETEGLF